MGRANGTNYESFHIWDDDRQRLDLFYRMIGESMDEMDMTSVQQGGMSHCAINHDEACDRGVFDSVDR